MRKTCLVALVLATVTSSAAAQDRWLVVSMENGRAHAIDTTTLERAGDVRTFWVRTSEVPVDEQPPITMVRFSVDCAARTFRILQGIDYDASGSALPSSAPPASDPQPIVPQSIGEVLARAACVSVAPVRPGWIEAGSTPTFWMGYDPRSVTKALGVIRFRVETHHLGVLTLPNQGDHVATMELRCRGPVLIMVADTTFSKDGVPQQGVTPRKRMAPELAQWFEGQLCPPARSARSK